MTNPTKAKKTKKMQTSIQAAMAVIPSTFGEFVVTMLKMLISTLSGRASLKTIDEQHHNFQQPIDGNTKDSM